MDISDCVSKLIATGETSKQDAEKVCNAIRQPSKPDKDLKDNSKDESTEDAKSGRIYGSSIQHLPSWFLVTSQLSDSVLPSKDGNIKSASISNYHDIESTADILARKAANRSAKSIDEKRLHQAKESEKLPGWYLCTRGIGE